MDDDRQQRARRQRLRQIAAEHCEEIHDHQVAEQIVGERPAVRYAAVTSEGSSESSYRANGNLIVAESREDLAANLAGEATEGWLAHGRVWDLDGSWHPEGNLPLAYHAEVG